MRLANRLQNEALMKLSIRMYKILIRSDSCALACGIVTQHAIAALPEKRRLCLQQSSTTHRSGEHTLNAPGPKHISLSCKLLRDPPYGSQVAKVPRRSRGGTHRDIRHITRPLPEGLRDGSLNVLCDVRALVVY